jgi:tetratricopeptide (TPR) repeat protein
VKWFLIGFLCLCCSTTLVKADAAGDLYNQAATALSNNQYDAAAAAFDQIITGYPNTPNIDEIRVRAGYAYLHAGKFPQAVDRLAKETAPDAKPAFRGTALYFTGLAQFSQGQKSTDKSAARTAFGQAATTFTTLMDVVTKAPTPDNQGYLEQALYYHSLCEYELDDYASSEKDLLQLTQQFRSSPSSPDYFLRLGSVYAVQTNQAMTSKQPAATISALADKALQAFDQVSRDPNALVQANEANMDKAEVLFLTAQSDPTGAGYQKALDAFRLVRRKDDMITLQQASLDQLRQKAQAQARASAGSGTPALNSLGNDLTTLIGREQGRLDDLKSAIDPVIQALIRMGECYVAMKQPDEARTILHRLEAHATLTPDQQQEVDFQVLYSYVLGGQIAAADKALTDYLSKHGSDPQADSISYQIASKLMERKDYAGALQQADRSMKDFPAGKYIADVIALKAQALNALGRIPEAQKVVDDFMRSNPTSPAANQMLLTKAQSEATQRDFQGALADFQKVKNNTSASLDLQAAADAGYIQALQSLSRFDDVIAESKVFAGKFPNSKSLPGVLVFQGMAMDQKHDPTAIAALQDVARKFPSDPAAPFALFYVVDSYKRANNIPGMIQAAADLRTAYPTSYALLAQAADEVSAILIKQKKFDDAIALYQPLATAPKPDIAAEAGNKIGAVWLAAAKALGYYQSMSVATRTEAEKRLSAGEQAYIGTLKNAPDQVAAVGDAFDGLVLALKQRRSWGTLKDADMEAYLTKITADLTSPDIQARLEMAKAGLVFVIKDGNKQFAAALDRYKKVIAAKPNLTLTRQETSQFGDLVIAEKDYPTALKVFTDLLNKTAPTDVTALGDAYYGLGATYLGQGDKANAKLYFSKLEALPGNGRWHPHILDADFGIALANEDSTQGSDTDAALKMYAQLMQNPQGGVALMAKAMIGYGRILEKTGHCIVPTQAGPNEFAIHYYQQPGLLFGAATPEQSAEGLYDAGQAYEKAGHKDDAKKSYNDLITTYGTSAPDWAAKALDAITKLG